MDCRATAVTRAAVPLTFSIDVTAMADLYRTVPPTGNAVIDGVVGGGAWKTATITYSFAAGDMDRNRIQDFDEGDWKAFYREIVGDVASFAGVGFQEVGGTGMINFRLEPGRGGEAGGPGPGVVTVDSVVRIDPDVAGSAAIVRLGTYSQTWFHEFGHALGLKHTHDTDGGTPTLPGVSDPGSKGTGNLNSQIYSVMGYTYPFWGEDDPFTPQADPNKALNAQPGSFGAIDIAALQAIYGARAFNTANDVYTFGDDVDANRGYTTIWDTGGTDEIRYAGTRRAKIDLRAATLRAEVGGGGRLSTGQDLTGGYTIANGVTIENGTGGGNDDILVGNDAPNHLGGLGGNDSLDGGDGDDVLDGGAGDDTLAGGMGDDRLAGGDGSDVAVYAGARSAYAVTRLGDGSVQVADTRAGAPEGRDTLVGVEGVRFADGTFALDQIAVATPAPSPGGGGGGTGGSGGGTSAGGDRTFRTDDAAQVTAALADAGIDAVIYTGAGTLALPAGIATAALGGAADGGLVGNAADNVLTGNAGNNRIAAGAGADSVRAGAGADLVYGNQGRDLIYGNQGLDTLFGGQDADTVFGGQGDDQVYGNFGDDIVYGNLGDDRLFGGQGDDILYGGQGDDVLAGNLGSDTLVGGLGADRYVFGIDPRGRDLVLGFDRQAGDRIVLGGQGYAVSTGRDGSAVLALSGGGGIELSGVRPDQVDAGFFAT